MSRPPERPRRLRPLTPPAASTDEDRAGDLPTAPSHVLVTHADQPLGRRIVKRLFHDDRVASILAVGDGPPPHAFDRYLSGPGARLSYARVDLSRHRPARDLFHSERVRRPPIDAVIYVPSHATTARPGSLGATIGPARMAGVSKRTSETRLVLQNSLEGASIRQLIALSSAFAYRITPGNSNHLTEESALDLDPDLPAETRAWVDCDMLLHGEIHDERLLVTVLRVPSVVGPEGAIYMHPGLDTRPGRRLRALGYDPMCSLVADQDLANAVRLALHARTEGIFNIAGREQLPLSMVSRLSGHSDLSLPGPLVTGLSQLADRIGLGHTLGTVDGPHARYGFSLDTARARDDLGYEARYRIGPEVGPGARERLIATPA